MNSDEYEEHARELLVGGKAREALALFQEGLARFPGDADLELGQGMALLDLGRPQEARDVFRALEARQPDLGDALQGLAEACLAMGLKEEAVGVARKACGPTEKDADFVHAIGHLLFRHKLYDAAAWCYRRAIELDRGHGHAWVGLAAALNLSGKRDEALKLLRDAVLDRLAGFWEAYSYLGCLLFDAGRTDEAQAILKKIPLDELGDPAAAQRLRALLDVEAHPERARMLELIEVRVKANRGFSAKEKEVPSESPDTWKPYVPFPDRFWQGNPGFVTNTSAGQDLESIFPRVFRGPCIFDGKDKPNFIRKPTASTCAAVMESLSEFLEAYPWRENPEGVPEDWWRESGAESLMSYTFAIVRCLKGKPVKKEAKKRLLVALDKVWPTLRDPSRTHSIMILFYLDVGTLLEKAPRKRVSAKAPRLSESEVQDIEIEWKMVPHLEGLGHGVEIIHSCVLSRPVAFIDGFGWYHGRVSKVTVEILEPSSANPVRIVPVDFAKVLGPSSYPGTPALTKKQKASSFLAHERPAEWTRALDEVKEAIKEIVQTQKILKQKGLVYTWVNG